MESLDRPTAALHRLLADAVAHGGQATLDALAALTYRDVHVAPWPAGIPGYRTLVNSQGTAALPIFTELSQLAEAAGRFGWLAPDGSVPSAELNGLEALRYAKESGLSFVVVDITSEHSLELPHHLFDDLVDPSLRKEPSGLFNLQASRPSSMALPSRTTSAPSAGASRLPRSSPPAAPTPLSSLIDGASGIHDDGPGEAPPAEGNLGECLPSTALNPPTPAPSDALLDALEATLRGYPEVEWACLGTMGDGRRALGLRVEARIRQRVQEIANRAGLAASPDALPVVLLDDPGHMRRARQDALVFFPWRRK